MLARDRTVETEVGGRVYALAVFDGSACHDNHYRTARRSALFVRSTSRGVFQPEDFEDLASHELPITSSVSVTCQEELFIFPKTFEFGDLMARTTKWLMILDLLQFSA